MYCIVRTKQYCNILYCIVRTIMYFTVLYSPTRKPATWSPVMIVKQSRVIGQSVTGPVSSTLQYSTLQYIIIQYSTAHLSTIQYSTEQCSTVQYSTILVTEACQKGHLTGLTRILSISSCDAGKAGAVQYCTLQYSIVRYRYV